MTGIATIVAGNVEYSNHELLRDETEVAAVMRVKKIITDKETIVLSEDVAMKRNSVQKSLSSRPNRFVSQFIIDNLGIMGRVHAVHYYYHPLVRDYYWAKVFDGPIVGFTGKLAGSAVPTILENRIWYRAKFMLLRLRNTRRF